MGRGARLVTGALVLLVLLSAGAGATHQVTEASGAGFWPGLWHGLISPVTVVVAPLAESVSVYAAVNDGGWYGVGFLLGVTAALAALVRSAKARETRRQRLAHHS